MNFLSGNLKQSVLASLLLLGIACLHDAAAAGSIRILALFSDKAMVQIDGKQRFLRVGKPSPEGVLLISANARGAVIEMDGLRKNYKLSSHVGSSFVEPKLREVRIQRSNNGSYLISGSINGRSVVMLVDTGATSVAMSEKDARRLGIQYRLKGIKTSVSTASGFANAYAVTLDRVRVGAIELLNVEGVVIEGDSPRQVLLGMSFLQDVDMDNRGSVLLLRSKF